VARDVPAWVARDEMQDLAEGELAHAKIFESAWWPGPVDGVTGDPR
jgi:hypothetical protein